MTGTRSCLVGSQSPHVLQSRLPTCAGHRVTGVPAGVVYCSPSHSGVLRSWGLLDPGAFCVVMVTAARQPAWMASSACSKVSHDAMVRPLRCEPLFLKK